MLLDTPRLRITDFSTDMAETVLLQSQDEDNRRFVPDEVFETLREAREAVARLMEAAGTEEGPFVHPVSLKESGEVIGYVQAVRAREGIEIGYHIAKPHTRQGYATEELAAFIPEITRRLNIRELWGIVTEGNVASCRVLEKCGFALVFRGEGLYQGETRQLRRYVHRA